MDTLGTEIDMADEQLSNDSMVDKLKQWFEHKISVEIIELIAYESGYELDKATNHLLDMAKDIEIPATQETVQPIKDVEAVELQATACALVSNPSRKASKTLTQRIIEDATRGIKILVLMRGLPGSGKSYLAQKIVEDSLPNCAQPSNFILSADDFFYTNGSYNYNSAQIAEAHRWNQKRANKLITDGISPIIIDNTNLQIWEMKPYSIWAVEHGYVIEILEPDTPWAFSEHELAKRNRHQVPRIKIREMLARYEKKITVEDLFGEFNLCYRLLPPLPRNFPPIIKHNNNNNQKGFIAPESTTAVEANTKNVADAGTITVNTGNPFALLSDYTITPNKGFVSFGNVVTKYPKEGLYDKSTMTATETDAVENIDMVAYLVSLFPTIPADYLKDVYEKCNNDIEWTVDLLLTDNKEIIENYVAPQATKRKSVELPLEIVVSSSSPEETEQHKEKIAEEGKELKQHLESAIEISREHYSPRMQKIKKMEPEPGPSKPIVTVVIDSDTENEDCMEISDESDNEEMMELNLGEHFVRQLDVAFGDPNIAYPKEFQPIIEIPKSLGRQLYALYLESIFKQMEAQDILMKEMMEQDEAFAKQLQAQEERALIQSPAKPKQRVQRKSHVSSQTDWENLTPDEFVEKLGKHRLFSYFPEVDTESLLMILSASDNCYNTTITTLLESGMVATETTEKMREPVVSESLLKTMKGAYDVCNETFNCEERDPEVLRAKARDCQQKRKLLLDESNNYCSRGQFEVAYFYCGLAKRQTVLCEQCGHLATELIMTDNFNKNPNFDTIDLHHLTVKASINALDIFLDRNIMLMQSEDNAECSSLNIITGRGRNSPGGIPRIKPTVKQRLTKRGIRFIELNPGLLRADIYKTSVMTSNLKDPVN